MTDRMLVATRKGPLTLARANGGWRIAATDFPGVAVTVTPRDPRDGALYAMLRHGHFGSKLHRSDDGGKTWQSLREGLPQQDAFDLVYRHGLDVDSGGTQLAMGSTTGALWTSDDGGERWSLVNAHLPPVYAVRFW